MRATTTTAQHSLDAPPLTAGNSTTRRRSSRWFEASLGSASSPGVDSRRPPPFSPLPVSPCLLPPLPRVRGKAALTYRQTAAKCLPTHYPAPAASPASCSLSLSTLGTFLTVGKPGLHRHTPPLLPCSVIRRHHSSPPLDRSHHRARLLTRRGSLHRAARAPGNLEDSTPSLHHRRHKEHRR